MVKKLSYVKPVLTCFIFLLISTGYSQEFITNDSIKLNTGYYRTFAEFLYNSPSFNPPVNISVEEKGFGVLGGSVKLSEYSIKPVDKELRARFDIFGYCDGKDIYVVVNGADWLGGLVYMKILYRGRYCYYETRGVDERRVPTTNGMSMPSVSRYLSRRAIDMITGKDVQITPKWMNITLKSDNTLLQKFNKESKQEDVMKDYLIQFSEQHRDDIESRPPSFTYNLGELVKMNADDNTFGQYYQRVRAIKDPLILAVREKESNYGNGTPKSQGLECRISLFGSSGEYVKVGTWKYFYKSGQLKELVEYDVYGDKTGRYEKYDDKGNLIVKKTLWIGDEVSSAGSNN